MGTLDGFHESIKEERERLERRLNTLIEVRDRTWGTLRSTEREIEIVKAKLRLIGDGQLVMELETNNG